MNNAQQTLVATSTAALPTVAVAQMGFADLLGVNTNAAINATPTMTKNKAGEKVSNGTRYCLLPISAKEGKRSMKTEFNLTTAQAKIRHAQELSIFSARAFAGVSGAIASGKMVLASIVDKSNGRMVLTLVPNNAVVVQAPVDLAAVKAFLAANPEAAKQLTA